MTRIFSGIQPTGHLHLGNYLGAIRQWIDLQHEHESFFCVVDLHAITVRQDPVELRQNVRNVAAGYLAAGLDPAKATIFVQSEVVEHTLLAWVLNTFTQIGELERMTQYKDKSRKQASNLNAGLFTYPALMAADILLYQTEFVPVGDDQKQHVELTRSIAERFNNHYGTAVFTIPEGKFMIDTARVMALDDPNSKMSKSATTDKGYISFADTADVIRKKIMSAQTDSGNDVVATPNKPGVRNLLHIYAALTKKTVAELEDQYIGKGYGDFKADLADVVVDFFAPIQGAMQTYLDDPAQLDAILHSGKERAQAAAAPTMKAVYDTVGLGY